MKRILVTPRSLSSGRHAGLEYLEARGFTLIRPTPGKMPSEADLLAAIPSCCGWIAGVEPVTSRVIKAARELRVISRNGSGVDNLPTGALEQRGIVVKRAGGANANGVAELTLGLMLSGFRHITLCDRGIRDSNWPRVPGRELAAATIGVIGLGMIGSLVSEKFLALGAKVLGFDPLAKPEDLRSHPSFIQMENMEDLITKSEGITLHAPLPPNNTPLIDDAVLSMVKGGVVIVNTARAGLIQPEAILAALETGRVSAYATDVFDTEPPEQSKLLRHDRCIMTSHVGALTKESVERTTQLTVNNLLEALEVAGD